MEEKQKRMTIAERLKQEGMQEGRQEVRRRVAKKMLRMNADVEEIIKIIGVTKEELEKFKEVDQQLADISINVKDFGAQGNGESHDANNFQQALDYLDENDGGHLFIPSGLYILEKTVLVPSNCHLVGDGITSRLRGYRSHENKGYALVANKGITDSAGYSGANNFSMSNVAIDTPDTNGIVLVHAKNVFFSNIYGVDAYHHIFDIAGSKNIFSDHIMITNSGTSPFQIDGYLNGKFNNHIWDGNQSIEPYHDDTENDGIYVNNSMIKTSNRVNYGIHLHRDGGKNIYFTNVLISNAQTGVHRDKDCHRRNVVFKDCLIENCDIGVNLLSSDTPDDKLLFSNVQFMNIKSQIAHFRDVNDLTLINVRASMNSHFASTKRILFDRISYGQIDHIVIDGQGRGSALWLDDSKNINIDTLIAKHTSRALRMESTCENINYTEVRQFDRDDSEISPKLRISDEEIRLHGQYNTSRVLFIEKTFSHDEISAEWIDTFLGDFKAGFYIKAIWMSVPQGDYWDEDVELQVHAASDGISADPMKMPHRKMTFERILMPKDVDIATSDRTLYVKKNKETTKGTITIRVKLEMWGPAGRF